MMTVSSFARGAASSPPACSPPRLLASSRRLALASPVPRLASRASAAGADASAPTSASTSAPAADPAEVYAIQSAKDDGESVVSSVAWLEARESEPVTAGVYAVYDADERMQFVGYRKNLVAAVRAHVRVNGPDAVKVRVAAFANKTMATRANLRAESDRWIEEWVTANGGDETCIPRGNLAVGAAEWTLSPEKWDEEAASVPGMNAPRAPGAVVGPDGDVVSPYADVPEEEDEPLDPDRELRELTVANVDDALNEVRPFLKADGGDVEVVGIEDGIVAVRMQGACGSCSSSTATLKGGIEKTLIRVFGDAVKEVVNLDGEEGGAGALSLSTEAVEEYLKKLAGAIHNYGGSVKVLEVVDGTVAIEFSGPLALAQSIASSIKGKFPLAKEVRIKQV